MYFAIRNKYFWTISLLAAFFLFSCSQEIEDQENRIDPIDGKVQIALQMPSGNNNNLKSTELENESIIKNLTLFIFESSTGNKEFSIRIDVPYSGSSSEIDMTRWASDQVIMILNTTILSDLNKTRNIHIVSNIAESKLAGVTNENSLKGIITDAIAGNIANPDEDNPFLMHGMIENHNFSTDVRASVSLVRNVAKVRMTINTQNFTFGGQNILLAPDAEDLSVKIANGADCSYIVSRSASPSAVAYYSGAFSTVTPLEREISSTKSVTNHYINENLRTAYKKEENATAFIIQIPYKQDGGTVKTENYYKVMVNQENGYKINRNTIYDITLNISSLGGESDASAVLVEGTLNVLPWNENTLISDISQTFLTVEETITHIGASKDFYYETNAEASDCSLDPADDWLTATFDVANNIKLTATGTTWTTPRETTLSIKVKNLTKVITVKQAPNPVTTNSITITPRVLYLSEVAVTKHASINLQPTSSSWLKIGGDASMATCSPESGTGNSSVTFTSGSAYGNTYYKFANLNSMEYDSIQICNLNLIVPDEELNIPGDGGNFTEYVTALGGDANWVVKSKSDWITSAANIGGELHFTIGTEPNEADRNGSIFVAHINDPNYTKEIKISQSAKYVKFEDFDYLLITYDWTNSTGRDMDTATEFINTGISSVDRHPVGWGSLSSYYYSGAPNSRDNGLAYVYDSKGRMIIQWGGDNRATSGSENIVLYMGNLIAEENLAVFEQNNNQRYLYINIYATWYTTADINSPINLRMRSYKNGTMNRSTVSSYTNVLYGTFTNSGGTLGIDWNGNLKILSKYTDFSDASIFRTHYTPMGHIRYDIWKNEAVATIGSAYTLLGRSAASAKNGAGIPILLGETKDEYGERVSNILRGNK
ncbi:MAG: hypothetical protein LBV43_09960 [Prevotella sp.]|jgi:methylglyoxal synthase|nr:hypothetical protein [Prevotella sp.]